MLNWAKRYKRPFKSLWIQKQPSRCIFWCSEKDLLKIWRKFTGEHPWYSWRKTKLILWQNGRETRKARFSKITILWVFAQLHINGAPSRLFPTYFANILQTTASQTLWKHHLCVSLTMVVLQSAENLLRNISAEVHLELLLNEF